jgi:hypothetical protein
MKKPVAVAYDLLAAPIVLAPILLAVLPASLVVSSLVISSPALAASPAYCALYAREYATSRIGAPVTTEDASAIQRVEDQAYYRCLNQDEAPQFPTTSAYFGQPLDDITGQGAGPGGPFQALDIHPKGKMPGQSAPAVPADTATTDSTEATSPPSAAKPTRVAAATVTNTRLAPKQWTPEWVTWCKAHYRSFDEASGNVLTMTGVKKLCP